MSKNVTGTIREKKGLYYAVVNYYGENEERKQKWFPTKLPVRGNKKKAEAILKQVLCEFEIPISKGEKVNLCVNQKIQIENTEDAAVVNVKSVISTKAAEDMSLDDFPKDQVQFLLFSDYLKKYVPLTLKRKKKIEATTYSAYVGNINNPIAPYFEEKGITLGELTAEDIQDFYDVQLERVTANTVIHYHAIIRLALCYARKMGYIKENPIEEVDKPEKNQFVGKFYNSSELSEVIRLTKNTKLELPVIFGGFYGLRRSEIVGLRWSAIDFDNNVFYNFLYKIKEAGINVPVVAGIMPITNAKQVSRAVQMSGTSIIPYRFKMMVDAFGDNPEIMKQAGIIYASEQIIDLIANGVKHIHVYTMNKPDIAAGIMNNISELLK